MTAGSIYAVFWKNGVGKSTLMKVIYGVERPGEDAILWIGKPVHLVRPPNPQALGIGMVFQHCSVLKTLSVKRVSVAQIVWRWTAPIPIAAYPATFVTGMPSAVSPFRTATRIWNSAICRSKSRAMHCPAGAIRWMLPRGGAKAHGRGFSTPAAPRCARWHLP